jgi:hypothetical protein
MMNTKIRRKITTDRKPSQVPIDIMLIEIMNILQPYKINLNKYPYVLEYYYPI